MGFCLCQPLCAGKGCLTGTDRGELEIKERVKQPLQRQIVLWSEQLKISSLSWGWRLCVQVQSLGFIGQQRELCRVRLSIIGCVPYSFMKDASGCSFTVLTFLSCRCAVMLNWGTLSFSKFSFFYVIKVIYLTLRTDKKKRCTLSWTVSSWRGMMEVVVGSFPKA